MCGVNLDLTKILIYTDNPVRAIHARELIKKQKHSGLITVDTIIYENIQDNTPRELELLAKNISVFYSHIFAEKEGEENQILEVAQAIYDYNNAKGEILPLSALTEEKASEIANERYVLEQQYVLHRQGKLFGDLIPLHREHLARLRAKHQRINHKVIIEDKTST